MNRTLNGASQRKLIRVLNDGIKKIIYISGKFFDLSTKNISGIIFRNSRRSINYITNKLANLMKTTFSLLGIVMLLLSFSLNAQEPMNKKPGNPTVDSILGKYNLQAMPSAPKTEQIFPVIGQYQSNDNADAKIMVTLDETNKGFVWIDGLPQGRVKAILKRSPATYKIIAQKTADGKDVPEGTLIYDKDANVIHVLLGMPFNDENPDAVFTAPVEEPATAVVTKTKGNKTKAKVKKVETWSFTGTKVQQVTATNQ
jgi:hypothetical protein